MSDVERLVKVLLEKNMTICTAESCTGGLLASMIVDVPGASDVFERGFITYANEAKHELLGVTWDALHTFGAVSSEVAGQMACGAARAGAVGFAGAGQNEAGGDMPGTEQEEAGDAVPGADDARPAVGVGITGIAGPGGGTAEKPVGLVYIGCCIAETDGGRADGLADAGIGDSGSADGLADLGGFDSLADLGAEKALACRTFVERCRFSGDRRTVRESAAAEAVRFVLECLGK